MGECGKALDGESGGVGLFFTEVRSRKGGHTRPLVQYGAYPSDQLIGEAGIGETSSGAGCQAEGPGSHEQRGRRKMAISSAEAYRWGRGI